MGTTNGPITVEVFDGEDYFGIEVSNAVFTTRDGERWGWNIPYYSDICERVVAKAFVDETSAFHDSPWFLFHEQCGNFSVTVAIMAADLESAFDTWNEHFAMTYDGEFGDGEVEDGEVDFDCNVRPIFPFDGGVDECASWEYNVEV